MLLKMQVTWDVTLSVGDFILTFQNHYNFSNCQGLHSVISQKTCISLYEFPLNLAKGMVADQHYDNVPMDCAYPAP